MDAAIRDTLSIRNWQRSLLGATFLKNRSEVAHEPRGHHPCNTLGRPCARRVSRFTGRLANAGRLRAGDGGIGNVLAFGEQDLFKTDTKIVFHAFNHGTDMLQIIAIDI